MAALQAFFIVLRKKSAAEAIANVGLILDEMDSRAATKDAEASEEKKEEAEEKDSKRGPKRSAKKKKKKGSDSDSD